MPPLDSLAVAVPPAQPRPPAPQGPPTALLAPAPVPAQALGVPAVGFDRSNLDPTVRPQDDFYQYAVGGRLARSPIPDDKPSWGVDGELVQQTQGRLKDILEGLASRSCAPAEERKLGDLYASAMDTDAIEAAGLRPLEPLLAGIRAVQETHGLQAMVAELHKRGLGAVFGFGPTPDARDPQNVIGEAFQGGLGMPDRDYYFKDDQETVRVRDAYKAHVERTFALAGRSPEDAADAARAVMAVETRLASGALSRVEMRDPNALYRMMDRSELAGLTPGFDWDAYFGRLGLDGVQRINMATPRFFTELDRALGEVPVDDWKTYLEWRVMDQMAPYLSSAFDQEHFSFAGGVLKGVTAQPPRWKRAVAWTDEMMGEALGKKFVEQHFPPAAKARVLEMVDNVKAVLRDKIAGLPWMSDATKAEAFAKVDTLVAKIGYPDAWKDYSGLEVDRGVFASNVLRHAEWHAREAHGKIGKPVDRGEWEMTPSTVNAYYHPLKNEIVFPAAILQPPYFDLAADDAANYGATGATIGHELTHGFDDEGAQFDSTGRLRNWWQPEDLARFSERADGVERQFSEFSYDGQQVDGKLVKGESIADLGGLELAWAALQRAQAGKPAPSTDDGFTPEQRFFLSYALSWATNLRPEYAHLILSTDPHPLPKFRVLGPLANLPQFHAAFGVREGDSMMRPEEKRNRLWD